MNLLIENWYIIAGILALVVVVGVLIYNFAKKPSSEQLNKVREWLVFACIEAEKQFSSGTGELKLRFVYDAFVIRFPWLAKVVSFEAFSNLVDDALVKVRQLLETNVEIAVIVDETQTKNEIK